MQMPTINYGCKIAELKHHHNVVLFIFPIHF